MLQKDIKQVIISLISELDFYFNENGFTRRRNSLIYTKNPVYSQKRIYWIYFCTHMSF